MDMRFVFVLFLVAALCAGLFIFFQAEPDGKPAGPPGETTVPPETPPVPRKKKPPAKRPAPVFGDKTQDGSSTEAEASIAGRVLFSTGKPARGAEVVCRLAPEEVVQKTRTDGRGRFSFTSLDTRLSYTVAADVNGCAPVTADHVETGTGGLVMVVVQGSRIEGHVLTSDVGMPLDSFSVTVEGPESRSAAFENAGGRFRIEGLAAGRYIIAVKAAGYHRAEKQVDVKEGQEHSVQFLVPPQ